MDFPLNKDLSHTEQNRNNYPYLIYKEPNEEFLPFQKINHPKITMSYYFPEGNHAHNNRPGNFFQQKMEERDEKYYQFYDNKNPKENINNHTDKILENALKMVFYYFLL